MKILHLTLHKIYFDQILEGSKKIEYREIKPYWTKRFFDKQGKPITYDLIFFKNGYNKNSPTMEVEWKGIKKNKQYEISLGKVLKSSLASANKASC